MTKSEILQKLDELPFEAQQEALNFIEMLVARYVDPQLEPQSEDEPPKRRRLAGAWAGKVWMADDFDEPLEEFKEYM